jgi:toxin ParE1/3/4
MRVRWSETAFAELGEIRSYIAKDNPAAARAVVLRIEQVTTRLGRFPWMGSATDVPGIRVFPALPFPYLIFYAVGDEEVVIRNIRHARRQRPR